MEQIEHKVIRTIQSCRTSEQLVTAESYAKLAAKRLRSPMFERRYLNAIHARFAAIRNQERLRMATGTTGGFE